MPKCNEQHPPPHAKYVVKRNGNLFTATPCYFGHKSWWVVRLMPEDWPNEADPVPMLDDDEWWAVDDAKIEVEVKAEAVSQEAIDTVKLQLRDWMKGQVTMPDPEYAMQLMFRLLEDHDTCQRQAAAYKELMTVRPELDWCEEMGNVLWWKFPIQEPPYCGTPLDDDWPEDHTDWTPLPCPLEVEL